MKKTFIIAASIALFLTGCATPVQHMTPSGKVEAVINGTSKSVVKDQLVNDMINHGYTVTKSDSSVVMFDRPISDPLGLMFFGSQYDSTPNARVTFNLVQNGKAVRVIADCVIITNPGSAFEKRTAANNNQGTLDIQNWLNQVKARLERKR